MERAATEICRTRFGANPMKMSSSYGKGEETRGFLPLFLPGVYLT